MTIIIGILFIIILVIGHEFGHFFAAKALGLRVDEFGFGFPPRLFSKKKGDTTYSFNALPFGGFVRIYGEHGDPKEIKEDAGRSFTHQTALKRAVIVIAGVLMNFLIGWIAFSFVFAVGIPNRVMVADVAKNSPAAEAGFMAGDTIRGFSSTESFLNLVDAHKGSPITVNGLTIVPRENPPEGEGSLGLTVMDSGVQKEGLFRSIISGLNSAILTTWAIIGAFIGFFANIFGGNLSVVNEFSGPVGIFGMLGEASKLGIAPLIQFLGLISINLVVINMIPFPALDGGRFLTILVEKLVGRRINQKVEMVVNAVGLLFLLLIMVAVTIKDINNIL